MARSLTTLLLSAVLLSCTALWLAACAAPLGPGYIVEKQEVRVSFSPEPVPSIHIAAEYHLKNTGNQELSALDVRLPGVNGLDFQEQLAKANVSIPIIFITAQRDESIRKRVLEQGAVDILLKPFSDIALREALSKAMGES